MEFITISRFKAQALQILDRVTRTHEGIVVTKRGKPIAQVVPFTGEKKELTPGGLSDTLLFEKDIVSPLGEDIWEACK